MNFADRPRLASFVGARWHEGFVLLVDSRDGRTAKMGVREWAVLRQLDGSRDLEGVRLAARNAGAPVSLAEVRAFVEQLVRWGWLGGDARPEESSMAADRPIVPLPDYRFRCTGAGNCCRMFSAVTFSPLEAARARVTLPLVAGAGADPEAGFLPLNGLDPSAFAGPSAHGACAYLERDRCGLHSAGGADAKPVGCRTFPTRYCDDGREIRASVAIECRCVLESGIEGEPLTTARWGSELPRATYVPALGERIALGSREMERSEYLDWAAALPACPDDPARWLWAKADELAGADHGPQESFTRVASLLDARIAQHAWREATDPVRQGFAHLRTAASRGPRAPTHPRDEDLHWRASIWGHAFALDANVPRAMRGAALVLWLARAVPDEAEDDHPLAMAGALARGYGLTD